MMEKKRIIELLLIPLVVGLTTASYNFIVNNYFPTKSVSQQIWENIETVQAQAVTGTDPVWIIAIYESGGIQPSTPKIISIEALDSLEMQRILNTYTADLQSRYPVERGITIKSQVILSFIPI